MLTPLDLDHFLEALRLPQGWIELALIAVCFALGWLVDRREHVAGETNSSLARIGTDSINRLVFPVTTFLLLLVARAVFRHWYAPVFFPIFIPLVVALALIRLTVYAFRNILGPHVAPTVSERAVTLLIWGALALYYLGVLPEIASALDEARVPLGKTDFSVLDLIRDATIVVVAVALSVWASNLLQQRLMKLSHVDNNVRVVLSKITRALLVLVGVLVALSFVGIDLTVLSVFGGALGVGIGLGLQKLASNYIAGFTILLDRSIRVGDMVTVDGRYGAVSQVTSRYVVVRSLDGVEAIVPNETLITTTVLNHSYTSREIRIGIPVQISNDSDLDLAMRVLSELGQSQDRVLKREGVAPVVHILRFAENGIDLELVVWINDPEGGQQNLKSALYLRVWKAFREHGIKTPTPQRDIRVIGSLPADAAPPTTP